MKTLHTVLAAVAIILPAGPLSAQTVVPGAVQSVSPASGGAGSPATTLRFTLSSTTTPSPPPDHVPVQEITLGTLPGTNAVHESQYVVTAQFTLPADGAPGLRDATVVFPSPGGDLTLTGEGVFEVFAASGPPSAGFTCGPTSGIAPLAVTFVDTSGGSVTGHEWDFGDGETSTGSDPVHTYSSPGIYPVSLTVTGPDGSDTLLRNNLITVLDGSNLVDTYPVVDTGQTTCFDSSAAITPPPPGSRFHGQDAQHLGHAPSYTISDDGLTVTDHVTGLVWQRDPDRDGDGTIDSADKIAWADLPAYVEALNAARFGDHDDWRVPSIKELYSLVDFRGLDPSGETDDDPSGLIPFIDPVYFEFGYGDTAAGERLIDAQYWSSTEYVSTTMGGNATVFGFNFADGRIKGYPRDTSGDGSVHTQFIRCVRGAPTYGINHFVDHGDGTISDFATGLMWTQADSGTGMNWEDALAWVETRNTERHLGHDDWRLPDAKELQTLFDYTRAPATSGTAAIDPLFSCSTITAEDGSTDFPFYWTGTTHETSNGSGAWGVYLCFGTAFGYFGGEWTDVHGAGAQRSDPKTGSSSDYPSGHGPQGDAVRVTNAVRLVRSSPATADSDGDGVDNWHEYLADTDPHDPRSLFVLVGAALGPEGFEVSFQSSRHRVYTLWRSAKPDPSSWEIVASRVEVPGTGESLTLTDPDPPVGPAFYQVTVERPR